MPTLKQITCRVVLGDMEVKEYKHRFTDGAVETYIAVPSTDESFSLVVQSDGYIAPGLAAYVYIDGEYQANRNKIGFPLPHQARTSKECGAKFIFRQKEERMPDGRFVGRDWSFAKLGMKESSNEKAESDDTYAKNVGTIEVLVLRCAAAPVSEEALDVSAQAKISALDDESRAKSKISKPRAKSPTQPAKDKEPESQSESGGLFGLFDGAGDEPVHGDYFPKAYRRLPIRHHSEWRAARPRQPDHRSRIREFDMEYRRACSPDEWADRSRNKHSVEDFVIPNVSDTHRRRHRQTPGPSDLYSSPSRDAEDRGPRPDEPSSDELERLVVLHEQLRQSSTKAHEILKSKELFERTVQGQTSHRVQELSTQRLQELEQELQNTNAKRAKDTDFVFECLADMDRVQLAFARSALRSRDIVLPTLEQVKRWLRRNNGQVRVSIRSEIGNDHEPKDNDWEELGHGVVSVKSSKENSNAGKQDDQKPQRSQQDEQDRASSHKSGQSAWRDLDNKGDNTAAADDDRKAQTNEWDNGGRSEQPQNQWNNDGGGSKSKTKSALSKSTSTKVASQQQGGDWASPRGQSRKSDDRDKNSRSGTNSERFELKSSHSSIYKEPKRVVKPYWSSWGNHNIDSRRADGRRDAYEYSAQPAPALPKNKSKGVSHGLHIGKGTTYVHKNVQPKYMDTLQDPYAVFVFYYRSKQEVEKVLGRAIEHQPHKKTEGLDWEDLMHLSKEDLVRKLMESDRSGKEMKSHRLKNNHVSNDEITPDDSVSQVLTRIQQSVATKEHKKEGREHRRREHQKQEKGDSHKWEHHKPQKSDSHRWGNGEGVDKSAKKGRSQKGGSTNRSAGNDGNNKWDNQWDNKSKAASWATREHFAGAMDTTGGAGGVAW